MRRLIALLVILCMLPIFASAEGVEEPTDNPVASPGLVLQDPLAFFKTLDYHVPPKSDKGEISCSFKLPQEQIDALKEYYDCVVNNYSFEFRYQSAVEISGYSQRDNYLAYTGSEKVNKLSYTGSGKEGQDDGICLRIEFIEESSGWALLGIRYADPIRFVDDGFRCSFDDLQDLGDNAGDRQDDPSPDSGEGKGEIKVKAKEKKDCPYCVGGYNICKTCGGDGYIDVWVDPPAYSGIDLDSIGHYESKRCSNFKCLNGKVECSHCNGLGYTYE